jgi:hypothetical protein
MKSVGQDLSLAVAVRHTIIFHNLPFPSRETNFSEFQDLQLGDFPHDRGCDDSKVLAIFNPARALHIASEFS